MQKINKIRKSKIISFFIIGLIIGASIIPTISSQETFAKAILYVDDDADPSWYDATHIHTIQEGINNASIGDTVYVYNGTYYENVLFNKTLVLIGESAASTIINGGAKGDVINILANDTTIQNFTIKNAGNQPLSHSGIIVNSQNNTIQQSIISNNQIYGINVVSFSENMIINNTIINNGEGIRLYYATQNIIIKNIIANNYYGMRTWYSSHNTIVDNEIIGNTYYGIFDDSCQQTVIENNSISNSTYGIRCWSSSIIDIYGNQLLDNTIGLYFDADCHNNTIYNNYFDNTDNVDDFGINTTWNTTLTLGTNIIDGPYLGGNFWNDYMGYDTNADGIGDINIPYGPGDYLPLVRVNHIPIANFTYAPAYPSMLDIVQFNDTSTDADGDNDIVNWTWDFGDGNGSYEQNATHSYMSNGNFTITLSILDSQGIGNSTQQNITVLNLMPVASFIYTPLNPNTNDIVTFNSTSVDYDGIIINWSWDFNDGHYGYGENTTHSFENGTYHVVLRVLDDMGAFNVTNTTITVINIHPSVDFSYFPEHPSTEDVIEFYDLSSDRESKNIVNWTWDFNDGNSSYLQDPTHQYADNGTYNVTLTIMDNDGASNSTSKLVNVSNVAPIADFTFLPSSPLTSDIVYFNDTSTDSDGIIVNWSWDFGDGNSSFLQHPMHQYADNASYNVSLFIIDDDGANDSTFNLIYIGNAPPIANFSYTPMSPSTADSIMFNDSSIDTDGYIVSWSWDFGDGNISSIQNTTHSYAHSGIYTVSLMVTDEDGGNNVTSMPINVSNIGPNASFSYMPLTPSTAQTVQFTDTSTDSDGMIVNWSWDFGDSDVSYDQHPTHQYADNGTYNVTLIITDNNAASDAAMAIINVSNAIPVPNFTWSPANPTKLDSIQFYDLSSDRSLVSWNWDFGDGNLSTLQNPTHQYADDGPYNVTLYVSDDDGAINSITKIVTVYTISPVANFTYSPINPLTSEIIIFTDTSTDADGTLVNWSWDFGDGNSSYLQHPTHQYSNNGTFTINLTVLDDDLELNSIEQQIMVSNVGPSVNFSYLPLNPTTQDTIQFTDLSTDSDGIIVSWHWDFDDGYQSIYQNPPHQYDDDGVYQVNLTIMDDDGAVNSTIIPVTVLNVEPIVAFDYAPINPTVVDLISFMDLSIDVDGTLVNWSWDFGDGNSSYLQHPSHSYDMAGNYTIQLTVSDNDNATNTSTVNITVDPLPACFDEVWVDDDFNSSLWWWQITHFDSIQDAINAVCPNGTVYIAEGIYDEQLNINKSVTLLGNGKGSTIITNTTILTDYFTTSADNYPIVYIHNTDAVILENLTVDGAGNGNSNYRYIGIGLYDAGGTLKNLEIKSIRDTPFSGSQHGVSIYAYDVSGISRNLLIENCEIYDYQKNALSLSGADLSIEVRNNTITGEGPTNITAQNGIQVGYGATGIIENNSIYGNWYTGPYWGASGGLVYSSDNITIAHNIFDTNQMAVYYYGTQGMITNNEFYNNYWCFVLWGDAYIFNNQCINNTYNKTYMAEILSDNHCFTYIQDAIDASPQGDTVCVYDGEYVEDIIINKNITVTGFNPPTRTAILNGIVDITADDAMVSHLFIHPGNVTGHEAAVMIAASNITFNENIIDGIHGDGTGSVKGIHVYSTTNDSNILICNNQIINVSNNGNDTIYGGSDGIMIQGVVDDVSIINNSIRDIWSYGWTYGMEVTPTGSHPTTPPKNIIIEENTFDTISATVWGAYASCFSVDAYNNLYPANASEITLQYNNFLNTPYGAINKDTSNILDADCNYWDDYTGPYHAVANADGLGCLVTDNVTFIPWLDNIYPLGDCIGGACTDPVWVDDDAAPEWYDWDHVASIQTAIDRICVGGTIYIEPGVYQEHFTIDKYLHMIGSGSNSNGTIITQNQSGTGDSHIGIIQLIASGISPSEPILFQDLRLEPDHIAGFSVGRFTESTGTDVFYIKLDNIKVIGTNTNPNTEQERGFYVDLNSTLQYLEVDDSSFDNLTYGWYFQKEVSTDVSSVQYVSVENTSFSHNNLKGIYAEKLSDVTFKNCDIAANGFSSDGIPSYFLPWMAGFDFNLKAGSYKNIIIDTCSFTNNALGGAKEGVGLTIKERGTGTNPSATYVAYPASVDDITITACTFFGNERGIRMGEPEKGNVGPTNVTSTYNNIFGNMQNYSGTDGSAYGGLINVMQSQVNATCNWWGNDTGPFNTTMNPWGSGENISGNISFEPWLTNLYPLGDCDGYLNAPPVVDFTWNPINPTTADMIQFTDLSTDDGTIVNWSWDFGDGNSSHDQHPTHQYLDNDSYNVTLTIIDNFNVSNATWKLITVFNAIPIVDFTWTPPYPSTQDTVYFMDLSTDKSIVSWFWEFGDNESSSSHHPDHQYDDDGLYNVTLTVMDDDGAENETTKQITISNVAPQASFEYTPLYPTTNDTILFNDTSTDVDGTIVNWSWDFGDGNSSYTTNTTHQYASSGNYTVCLNITDNDGASDTFCLFIIVTAIEEILDVNQSAFDRGFPIRHTWDGDWGAAQNFTPTLGSISKVNVYLRKFGTPEFNLTVELREDSPEGVILDSIVFIPDDVESSWTWLEIDFNDTVVSPDTDYFIVLPPAPSGITTSFGYEWGYAFGDHYQPGSFWFTRDGGGLWRDLPSMYEFSFKTFGI
jgi:parallel beta-helix repeat protein